MSGGIVIIVVILVILVILVIAAFALLIGPYNAMVKLRNTIQEAWRQVDVELNRRYELIPNLVETVKGYAQHESGTLSDIVRLRNQAASLAQSGQAVPSEARAQTEGALSGAIHNLLVSVEAYPELKANTNFVELQRQLSQTEDRIANGRRYYNAVVADYNTKVESFPSNLAASLFKFDKATYFEVSDPTVRQAPTVDFGTSAQPSSAPNQSAITQASQESAYQADQFTQPGTVTPQPQADPVTRPEDLQN